MTTRRNLSLLFLPFILAIAVLSWGRTAQAIEAGGVEGIVRSILESLGVTVNGVFVSGADSLTQTLLVGNDTGALPINISDTLSGITSSAGTAGSSGVEIDIVAGDGDIAGTGGKISLAAGTGGLTNADGGDIDITSGTGSLAGDGGSIALLAGSSTTTGAGGGIAITAGLGGTSNGAGGPLALSAGAGNGSTGNGGLASLSGGSAAPSIGTPGNVDITGGVSPATNSTAGGSVNVTGGPGTANNAPGGAVVVTGGAGGTVNSAGGSVSITSGAGAGSGDSGTVLIDSGPVTGGAKGTISIGSGIVEVVIASGTMTFDMGTDTLRITDDGVNDVFLDTPASHLNIRTIGSTNLRLLPTGSLVLGDAGALQVLIGPTAFSSQIGDWSLSGVAGGDLVMARDNGNYWVDNLTATLGSRVAGWELADPSGTALTLTDGGAGRGKLIVAGLAVGGSVPLSAGQIIFADGLGAINNHLTGPGDQAFYMITLNGKHMVLQPNGSGNIFLKTTRVECDQDLKIGGTVPEVYLGNTEGVQISSALQVQWSSTTNAQTTPHDAGLTRNDAGTLRVTDGSTGRGNLIVEALVVGGSVAAVPPGTIAWPTTVNAVLSAGTLDIDTASGANSFDIGAGADAGGGDGVTVVGEGSVVPGSPAKVTVIGANNDVRGAESVAVGSNITGPAIGNLGLRTVYLGNDIVVLDPTIDGVVIGDGAMLSANAGIAIGANSDVTNQSSIAMGPSSQADGQFSGAFGNSATVSNEGSWVFGRLATDSASHQVTFGGANSVGAITHFRIVQGSGATTGLRSATVLLSSVSGATVTASGLIPDGAALIGVSTYIVTELGTGNGTSGYTVGTLADPDRWAADVGAITVGTFSDNSDATADARGFFTSAGDVVITFTGGDADGTGAIRIVAHYHVIGAPTQ